MDEQQTGAEDERRSTESYPEFDFVNNVVDTAVTYQKSEDGVRIILDEPKIQALVKKMQADLSESGDSPEIEERSRVVLEDCLRLAVKHSLIPATILHDAARFSVPRNITTTENNFSRIDYARLLDERGLPYNTMPIDFPDDWKQRDRTVEVTIGKKAVKNASARYVKWSEKLRLPLTPDQCEEIAIAENVVHEHLGHGTQYALEAHGETFFWLKEQILSEYRLYDLNETELDMLFGEFWSRGMERIMLEVYLTDMLKLTPDETNTFLKEREKYYSGYDSAFQKLLLQVQKSGKAPDFHTALETYKSIQEYLKKNADIVKNSDIDTIANWPWLDLIAYNGKPFTKAEIQFTLEEHKKDTTS